MRLAERRRVDARDVEVAEERHHPPADEGHVEIARAGPVGVERLVRHPLVPRHRAAAQDHLDTRGGRLGYRADELLVAVGVVGEREPDDARADRVLVLGGRVARRAGGCGCRLLALGGVVACFCRHLVR